MAVYCKLLVSFLYGFDSGVYNILFHPILFSLKTYEKTNQSIGYRSVIVCINPKGGLAMIASFAGFYYLLMCVFNQVGN